MTIKDGNLATASDVITAIGRVAARQNYANGASDTADGFFRTDIYTTASASTGTTAQWIDADDSYQAGVTDEASGDTTNDPTGVTNPENFFDDDDDTYASHTSSAYLGKNFASKYVASVKIKAYCDGAFSSTGISDVNLDIYLQTYDGATWTNHTTLASLHTQANGPFSRSLSYDDTIIFDATTQGIRIYCLMSANDAKNCRFYSLEYGDYDALSIVKENSIFSITPKSMVVYANKVTPTDTGITMDISDDGGSTYAITGASFDEYIDTTGLSGTDISLKFNLTTTDEEVTPELLGWSAVITDS